MTAASGAEVTHRVLVAVVGPGETATSEVMEAAERVGRAIAERGWVTLTGGRAAGVMQAASRAASRSGGLTIGVLPGTTHAGAAKGLDIVLATGLGEARNVVIATACDAMIACGMNAGTASEVALALRAGKPVAMIHARESARAFFDAIGADSEGGRPYVAGSVKAALHWLDGVLGEQE